jgi:hypothetical protein
VRNDVLPQINADACSCFARRLRDHLCASAAQAQPMKAAADDDVAAGTHNTLRLCPMGECFARV